MALNGTVTVWHIAGLCLVLGPGLHPVVEPSLPNPPPPILAAGHKPKPPGRRSINAGNN